MDDTFISLRYAQNLAQGHGLVYNPGERVEGYTNFLWTAALALPFLLRLDPLAFLKTVNVLLAFGTALATYRLGRATVLKDQRGLATVAAALVLASPAVPTTAVEGLETLLFTLLLVVTAASILDPRRARVLVPALLLSAVTMTRPDGALMGLGCLAIASVRPGGRSRALRIGALFVALYGVYFLARRAYYGQWLPNTFYAKGGGDPVMMAHSLESLSGFLGEYGGLVWVLAVPALLGRAKVAAWAMAAIVALRLGFHYWSGGPWMGHYRFLIPVLPFVYLLVLSGIAALPLRPPYRAGTALVVCLLLLVRAWHDYPAWESHYRTYAAGLRAAHVRLGLDVRGHTSPDAMLAMDDAGAGPYYAGRRNLDMLGLTDPHISHLPGRFYEKFDVPYVLARRPDLIVLLSRSAAPASVQDWLVPSHAVMAQDSSFRAGYRLARRYEFAPDYHLLLFRRTGSSRVDPALSGPG